MGRKKLIIRRLETRKERLAKFSKRKAGLLRKAKELGILCEADLALLMFSPTGKPTVFVSQNKELGTVLEKMSSKSVEDREESRRIYTMTVLKKAYEKDPNIEVDPRNFSVDRNDVLKLQEDRLKELKEKLDEKNKTLSDWKNPENVEDLSKIKFMEEHLVGVLNKLKIKKSQLTTRAANWIPNLSDQATDQDLHTN